MKLNGWAYKTPLEGPDEPTTSFTVDERVITVNGMSWQARSDCEYRYDYYAIMERIEKANKMTVKERVKEPLENEENIFRNLMKKDLFFIVYFVMKNPLANHPFIVEACKEIQDTEGDTLEVWARDHLKTTIISKARVCQKVFNDPERRIGIFSATRPLAVKIQSVIRDIFESPFVIRSFTDILYENPRKDAPKWSEAPEGGLIVKREGFYTPPTVSAWGLVDGMPTGYHFTDMIFDDIVTQGTTSVEMMKKVKDNFDMAENLSARDCQITVVGTFYRHDDPLVYIMNKTDVVTGKKMFLTRKKPATVGGELKGKAVFSPEKTLQKKRAGNQYYFFCQQLLDPTPRGQEKLNPDHMQIVKRKDIPSRLYKFMLIDGAGDKGRRQDRAADAWSLMVIGVEPYRDELGTSKVYILDAVIKPMTLVDAQEEAVAMYSRNGRILKLGIEKVGMSSTEIHIAAALRAKGKYLSVKNKNLVILKPGSRSKQYRIESALSWPLKNGKVHMLEGVALEYRERLLKEMEKFPSWHEDGLDTLSYVYDIIKDYRFGEYPSEEEEESVYDRAFRKSKEGKNDEFGWMH